MEKYLEKWIAVDWGTSLFRAYLIENEEVLCSVKTNDGMKFVQNNNGVDFFMEVNYFIFFPLFFLLVQICSDCCFNCWAENT